MNAPNPLLCDVYGTSKMAGMASTIAAGLLTTKLMQSERERMDRLIAEAERMNQIARVLEARKMRATNRGLNLGRGGVAPDTTNYGDMDWSESQLFDTPLFKGGSVQHVREAARVLAQLGAESMDKEAIGALSAMLPGIAKAVSGAASKGGGFLSGLLGRGGKAVAAPAGKSRGFLSGLLGGGKPPPSTWQKFKGGVTPGWKTKALVGGAALTGAAGLYMGGKAAKDYMTIPSGMGGWRGHGGRNLRHNVSGFGGGYAY